MKLSTAIIIIVALIVAAICIVKYNTLSDYDEAAEKSFAPLTSFLQERYQAVPRLVSSIVLYTGKEDREVKQLNEAYKAYTQATTMQQRVETSATLEATLMNTKQQIMDRYPGISSNYQFNSIAKTIAQAGNDLMGPLGAYNTAASTYNSYVRRFPNNIVGAIFMFPSRYPYFKRES